LDGLLQNAFFWNRNQIKTPTDEAFKLKFGILKRKWNSIYMSTEELTAIDIGSIFFAITIAILNYFDYVVKFTQHQQTQIKKYF